MSVARATVEQRKAMPLASGVLDYFPDALLVVAEVSRIGNEQHHPGEPLHWDKSKSTDEADALMRHLLDRGTIDTDGVRHTAKVAWRALALLQRELDAEAALPPVLEATMAPDEGTVDGIKVTYMGMDLSTGEDITVESTYRDDGTASHRFLPQSILHPMFKVDNHGEDGAEFEVQRGPGGWYPCCGATEHTLDCPEWP